MSQGAKREHQPSWLALVPISGVGVVGLMAIVGFAGCGEGAMSVGEATDGGITIRLPDAAELVCFAGRCCEPSEAKCEGDPDTETICTCPEEISPGAGGSDAATAGSEDSSNSSSSPDSSDEPGQTCSDECTSEATECNRHRVRHCGNFDDDDCLEWSDTTACVDGCLDGKCLTETETCRDECDSEGETKCTSSGGVKRCGHHYDADDCLEWSGTRSCADGCADGKCLTETETCSNECDSEGDTECQDNGERRCGHFDNDDCLEWSDTTACTDGCADGKCQTKTCSNECDSEGDTECHGIGMRRCDDFDNDGCLEWSDATLCEDGCVNDRCKTYHGCVVSLDASWIENSVGAIDNSVSFATQRCYAYTPKHIRVENGATYDYFSTNSLLYSEGKLTVRCVDDVWEIVSSHCKRRLEWVDKGDITYCTNPVTCDAREVLCHIESKKCYGPCSTHPNGNKMQQVKECKMVSY